MAYNDNVRLSVYDSVAAIETVYRELSSHTTAERLERGDGWWVTFDGVLSAAVDDRDIPSGVDDPQAIARERVVRFIDPREKGHEFGPACVTMDGEVRVTDVDRLMACVRGLARRHPVTILALTTVEYLGHSATLIHGDMECVLYDVGKNPKTGAEEFSALTGHGYKTLVSEVFQASDG